MELVLSLCCIKLLTVTTVVHGVCYSITQLLCVQKIKMQTIVLCPYIVKAAVVVLPLLGITWVLGLFAVSRNTLFFAWLFTITHCRSHTHMHFTGIILWYQH